MNSIMVLVNGVCATWMFYEAYKMKSKGDFGGYFWGCILFGVLNTICVFL